MDKVAGISRKRILSCSDDELQCENFSLKIDLDRNDSGSDSADTDNQTKSSIISEDEASIKSIETSVGKRIKATVLPKTVKRAVHAMSDSDNEETVSIKASKIKMLDKFNKNSSTESSCESNSVSSLAEKTTSSLCAAAAIFRIAAASTNVSNTSSSDADASTNISTVSTKGAAAATGVTSSAAAASSATVISFSMGSYEETNSNASSSAANSPNRLGVSRKRCNFESGKKFLLYKPIPIVLISEDFYFASLF